VAHAFNVPIPLVWGQATSPYTLLLGGCLGSRLEIIAFKVGVVTVRMDRRGLSLYGSLNRLSTDDQATIIITFT
jgi:hypothetical protein